MNQIKHNEWFQIYEVIVSRPGDEGEPDYKTLAELYEDSTCVIHQVARRSSTKVRLLELHDKVVEYGGNPSSVLSPNRFQSLPTKGDVLNQMEGAWWAFVSQQGQWAQKQGGTTQEVVEEAARLCTAVPDGIRYLRGAETSTITPWGVYEKVLETTRETLAALRVCPFAPSVEIAMRTLMYYLEHLEGMVLVKSRVMYLRPGGLVQHIARTGNFFDGTMRDVFMGGGEEPTWKYCVGDFQYTGEVLSRNGGMVMVRPFRIDRSALMS